LLTANGSEDPLVLVQGSTLLSAYSTATGKEVWSLKRGAHPIASSCLAGNRLFVPGENGLEAFELQAGSAAPKLLWQKPRLSPSTASPLVTGDHIFSLRGAILVVGDAKTGDVITQIRLKGDFSSSPVAAGNLLYCFSENGQAQVVQSEKNQFALVSSGAFAETILCTPAIADGALYVRSDKHLWKVGTGRPRLTSR
jgi:outer membrane protein assembly factor BamB